MGRGRGRDREGLEGKEEAVEREREGRKQVVEERVQGVESEGARREEFLVPVRNGV